MSQLAQGESINTSTFVRAVDTPDGAVLLDLDHQQCVSLNPVAARVWELLQSGHSTKAAVVTALTSEFPTVPAGQIDSDVSCLLQSLADAELLVEHNKTARRSLLVSLLVFVFSRRRRRSSQITPGLTPLIIKVLLGLFLLDVFGFRRSFRRTYELVRAWGVAPANASSETVDRIVEAMRYARVFYPRRVRCLQKSAVLTCLARSYGAKVEMVMAAQKSPFKAHAWSRFSNGNAIGETRDRAHSFLIWEIC